MEHATIYLRKRYPGMAKQAEKQPLKAIRLFCLHCMGAVAESATDVRDCKCSETCFLWPFRFGLAPVNRKLARHSGTRRSEIAPGEVLETKIAPGEVRTASKNDQSEAA